MNNLQKIQNWIKKNNYKFFFINRTDEFLSEYIAPYAERLNWISNFSGSAGRAIISYNQAILFVDGRYIYQAYRQIDKKYFTVKHLNDYWEWLEQNVNLNDTVVLDPSLHSNYEVKKFRSYFEKKTIIKFLEYNPIDFFWKDQPSYPKSKVFIHKKKYSGRSSIEKLNQIQLVLKEKSIDFYILTTLDSIAWLMNIRGNDINYTPLILSFAIIPKNGKIEYFVEKSKIIDVKKKLKNIAIFHSFKKIKKYLGSIEQSKIIGIDEVKTSYNFNLLCKKFNLKIKYLEDPCSYPKAKKNSIEISGAKKANIRDGASVTKFIYWLKNRIKLGKIDETICSNYLYKLRKKNKLFYSLSFKTISAVNQNASLPHYNLTSNSNLVFKKNMIYLFDSGAQYFDGTTDITRTIILGKATSEQKNNFTRVLKGHIAIALSNFKLNTKGSNLDHLARKSLQDIGSDYDHGTGHGIGSFLSVHEGPQSISKSKNINEGNLQEGMILSNEPGFYKKGKYGIRIENLVIVKKKANKLLGFETISYVPIDKNLINSQLLTVNEINWINQYHAKVYKKLKKNLNTKESTWLKVVTQPL